MDFLNKEVMALLAAGVTGITSYVAMKVGFAKDIEALQEETRRLRAMQPPDMSEELRGIRESLQEIKESKPREIARTNDHINKLQAKIQQNALGIQKLELEGAAAQEQRTHQIKTLQETKDMMTRQADKQDNFQRKMIEAITQLSTSLDERTKQLHS